MVRKNAFTLLKVFAIISITCWLFYHAIKFAWNKRSPTPMVHEADIIRYANVSWPKRRIPRIIHQTYRTKTIPSIWNETVQSVLKRNSGIFEYRQWSHEEMEAFVKEHEPKFYVETYTKYPHDMQRIDSFRYVLMFYIGGIYIDMDNGCNRPFQDLINTLEALDPESSYLTAFPQRFGFGVESDLIISTAGHPFYRQLISRLPWFNHKFLIDFWTMLVSAGPIYVSIQERFFSSSPDAVFRMLDGNVYNPMFIYKRNGLSWIGKDAQFAFLIHRYQKKIVVFFKATMIFLFFLLIYLSYEKRLMKLFSFFKF